MSGKCLDETCNPSGWAAHLSLPILASFSSANKDTESELAAGKSQESSGVAAALLRIGELERTGTTPGFWSRPCWARGEVQMGELGWES